MRACARARGNTPRDYKREHMGVDISMSGSTHNGVKTGAKTGVKTGVKNDVKNGVKLLTVNFGRLV